MDNLMVWLSEVPLLEGNYREFRVGQEVRFALQLHPRSVLPAVGGKAGLEPTEPGYYRFHGPLVYRREQTTTSPNSQGGAVTTIETFSVLDLGPLAYYLDHQCHPPSEAQERHCWTGEASLCVAWHYFERYAGIPDAPPLAYCWEVRRILLDESPWVTVLDAGGQPCVVRDRTQPAFSEVSETTTHGYRRRSYLLHCALSGAPSRSRAEAITAGEG